MEKENNLIFKELKEEEKKTRSIYMEKLLTEYKGNVSAIARAKNTDRSNILRLLRTLEIKASTYRQAA